MVLDRGIVIITVVAVPGARAHHVIDDWDRYAGDPLAIVLPPPTDLPWAIPIECAYRVEQWPCAIYPEATTGFHPLFLYESVSGVVGAITLLWVARRWGTRLRRGDLFLTWLIWYSLVRFALEPLRAGNWTIGGIPTATMLTTALALGALAVMVWRHRGPPAQAMARPAADREEPG